MISAANETKLFFPHRFGCGVIRGAGVWLVNYYRENSNLFFGFITPPALLLP